VEEKKLRVKELEVKRIRCERGSLQVKQGEQWCDGQWRQVAV